MRADRPTSPLIPGFDFLKTLASQAGKGLEGLNQLNTLGQGLGAGLGLGQGITGSVGGLGGFKQWVAPTLDPDELEKRIEELRTVQFWLEQNARLLGATIQALEVQKMTLNTLRSMNMKMPDLQQVLGAMVPQGMAADEPKAASAPSRAAAPEKSEAAQAGAGAPGQARAEASETPKSRSRKTSATAAEGAAGLVDPMKWWGALTEQFQQLASQAMASAPGPGGSGRAKAPGTAGPSAAGTGGAPEGAAETARSKAARGGRSTPKGRSGAAGKSPARKTPSRAKPT